MTVGTPHYLLFSEATAARPGHFVASSNAQLKAVAGRWRFVLESVEGDAKLEAADHEPQASGERLELLAVVRGLEALNQPSRVTLLTSSRYVNRGIRFGLDEWRENQWQWECFGKMMPVKNRDLWQRMDRALKIHEVNCRTWVAELPETAAPPPRAKPKKSYRLDDSHALPKSPEPQLAEAATTSDSPSVPETPSMAPESSFLSNALLRPAGRSLRKTWEKCRAGFPLPGMFRLGRARMSG